MSAQTPVAAEPAAKPGRRSLQERIEASVVGRVVISLFVIVTLITLVTANLPASDLQGKLLSVDHWYLYGAGLDQNWGVFAPDPRRQTVDVSADVTFADGSHATWHPPTREPVFGGYIDYRWLKWEENAASIANSQLWQPIAVYAARKLATNGRRPVAVSVRNHYKDLYVPGEPTPPVTVHDNTLYTTRITPRMLEQGS